MLVPKMVKNGQNSVAAFESWVVLTRKQVNPRLFSNLKKNKSHFWPIKEHTCALSYNPCFVRDKSDNQLTEPLIKVRLNDLFGF
jgi:hypothetical protein